MRANIRCVSSSRTKGLHKKPDTYLEIPFEEANFLKRERLGLGPLVWTEDKRILNLVPLLYPSEIRRLKRTLDICGRMKFFYIGHYVDRT